MLKKHKKLDAAELKVKNYMREKYISQAAKDRDPLYDEDHPPPPPPLPPKPPKKVCLRCENKFNWNDLKPYALRRDSLLFKQILEDNCEEKWVKNLYDNMKANKDFYKINKSKFQDAKK